MAKYRIYTQIESNVSASDLFYDLSVYRTDAEHHRQSLLSVTQQPLNAGYLTQQHETGETDDDLSVIYLMEIMLYRRHGGKLIPALSVPSTKMYTLGEMASGNAFSANKRENVCYFETLSQTKPVSEEGDKNIHSVKITCLERAFIAREYPIGDPDDPFERRKIEQQIASRLSYASYPDQGSTSLCGPAAFFYCLQVDRPDVYAQAARELWLYGKTKIGALEISPGEGCRHPAGSFYFNNDARISGLDWITMASLRDSENSVMSYDGIDDQVSGITLWGGLSKWFELSGYERVFNNAGLMRNSVFDIVRLNAFIKKGYKVVTLISAGMLTDFGVEETSFKNHWVVWEGVLRGANGQDISESSSLEEVVDLRLFSWGKVGDQIKSNKSLRYVCKHLFGGVVFKPLK